MASVEDPGGQSGDELARSHGAGSRLALATAVLACAGSALSVIAALLVLLHVLLHAALAAAVRAAADRSGLRRTLLPTGMDVWRSAHG
jgi:hypothetical protein